MFYVIGCEFVIDFDDEKFYCNERGFLLRVGVGEIEIGDGINFWEEFIEILV